MMLSLSVKKNAMCSLLALACVTTAFAFSPLAPSTITRSEVPASFPTNSDYSDSRLFAGGFGGGGGKKQKKKKASKEIKLKPKQQWDRYLAMKGEERFAVGVRIKEDESDPAWIEVGRVKSKGAEFTEVSVAKQRALIAEHAIRLFPLQVSAKKAIEWGYKAAEGGDWKVVDKSILDGAELPDGIEKMIGFEGTPDPNTGFYCVYDGGKIRDIQTGKTSVTTELR